MTSLSQAEEEAGKDDVKHSFTPSQESWRQLDRSHTPVIAKRGEVLTDEREEQQKGGQNMYISGS